MKNFLKDNWFKVSIVIVAVAYILVLFLNFYLEAKEYNLRVYKDSVKWCLDFDRGKSVSSVCKKSLERYYINQDFFISNNSEKMFERELKFWDCYREEWNKNHNAERASKFCSEEADKVLK